MPLNQTTKHVKLKCFPGTSLLDNKHLRNILALHVLLSDSGASLLDNNHLRNILALHVLLSDSGASKLVKLKCF
jgi:hypothetical protein